MNYQALKYCVFIGFITLLVLPLAFAQQENRKNIQYMGVASCASSNCHGANSPRKGDVLQNEFTTWRKHGEHSKAWRVLLEEDAKQIAQHLGINHPEKDKQCLHCHATYIPNKELQGGKYTIEDGVGCESCHGAAGGWLTSHTKNGVTHEENVKNGMTNLTPFSERTKLCLDCHYGNERQTVDHRLIGAGHPRLTFELDTFSMIQPRHWEVDEDYLERKAPYHSAQAWITGQVIIASEQMKKLLSPTRSKNGIWPELTLFTCESCHHSLKEDRWKVRRFGGQAGELRLNLSSLVLVTEVMAVVNPSLAKKIKTHTTHLHDDYREGKAKEDIEAIRKILNTKGVGSVQQYEFNDEGLKNLFHQLVRFSTNPHFQYEEAEQILMGMSSILASSPSLKKLYGRDLDRLYESLKDDEAFVAEDFTRAASKLLRKL